MTVRFDFVVIGNRERVVLAAFVVEAILAGGNAVAIRFSNRELAPLWGAGLRFALAAVLIVAVMAALRLALPRGQALLGALLFGIFQFAGAFGLYYYALVHVHAGLGQTLLALVPLATLLLAVAQRQESLRGAAVVGTLVGLMGVGLISGDPSRGSIPLVSLLAIFGSVLCFAEALVLVRRLPRVHPVTLNAVGMVARRHRAGGRVRSRGRAARISAARCDVGGTRLRRRYRLSRGVPAPRLRSSALDRFACLVRDGAHPVCDRCTLRAARPAAWCSEVFSS